MVKTAPSGRRTSRVGIHGQSRESVLLCSAILTLPFLDAPRAPFCAREVGCQHLDGLILEREGPAAWDEGRGCDLGKNCVCLLAVTAMTILRNMFARRHDGVEALEVSFEWLELDLRWWVKCDGCDRINIRDRNLICINSAEKAKGSAAW